MVQGPVQLYRAPGLEGIHRPLQQVHVERKTHLLDLAALLLPQQLAGAADLQVVGRQGEAGPQFLQGLDGLQALLGIRRHHPRRGGDEIGIGAVMGAPHPAAQLVQLRQAQLVGAVHQDGIGAGDVDAALDDGGAHQQVEALVIEVAHHPFQVTLAHLAVGHLHPRLRHQGLELLRHVLDGLHLVVEKIDLAAALQLALHRLLDQGVVPGSDEGLDGVARHRRGGDDRQVAQPGHGHVQGAGDGGGGEGKDVHLGAQGLEALLVAHPEAVLLVDDHQPQVFEAHRRLQQLVGADDDIHRALGQAVHDPLGLAGGAETRQVLHLHRPVGEAVGKVLIVLLGEQGGGHQHRHLAAAVDGDEGRAHGHLGLAEAHVAAHHPVHGLGRRHAVEDGVDRPRLVRGLLELEGGGEGGVVLPRRRKGHPLAGGAAGVDVQQLRRHVVGLLRRLALELVPLIAAQAVQGGVLRRGPGVARDEVQGRHRHVELVTPGVLQGQELGGQAADGQGLES